MVLEDRHIEETTTQFFVAIKVILCCPFQQEYEESD